MNMLAIRYFCLILETEESISEIGSQKKLSYDFVLPRKLSNDSERRAQVSTSFSLQSSIVGFTLFNLKNRALS